jgi:hypothetical protein
VAAAAGEREHEPRKSAEDHADADQRADGPDFAEGSVSPIITARTIGTASCEDHPEAAAVRNMQWIHLLRIHPEWAERCQISGREDTMGGRLP